MTPDQYAHLRTNLFKLPRAAQWRVSRKPIYAPARCDRCQYLLRWEAIVAYIPRRIDWFFGICDICKTIERF